MKKIYALVFLLLPFIVTAQPVVYYTSATGLSGQPLRLALRNIIRPHTKLSYTPGLWDAYYTTDKNTDGKLWDIYSDVPGGTPAYEFTLGTDQCGSAGPSAEGGCYNREHTWPQSYFSSDTPMQTDVFIVYPTDYWVNNHRGNLPYGKVGTAAQTFTNGTKIGNNVYAGAPTGNCFEPIDSFKGDLARTYFYISTCYRNDSAVFSNWEMANQVTLTPWTVQMLLEWHHMDPVSAKEIARNNAAYAVQGNRNPFIDHPEYADCIWGTGGCSGLGIKSVNTHHISVYPDPAHNEVTISYDLNSTNSSVLLKVCNISGQVQYSMPESINAGKIEINTITWPRGMYFIQLVTANGTEVQKIIIE